MWKEEKRLEAAVQGLLVEAPVEKPITTLNPRLRRSAVHRLLHQNHLYLDGKKDLHKNRIHKLCHPGSRSHRMVRVIRILPVIQDYLEIDQNNQQLIKKAYNGAVHQIILANNRQIINPVIPIRLQMVCREVLDQGQDILNRMPTNILNNRDLLCQGLEANLDTHNHLGRGCQGTSLGVRIPNNTDTARQALLVHHLLILLLVNPIILLERLLLIPDKLVATIITTTMETITILKVRRHLTQTTIMDQATVDLEDTDLIILVTAHNHLDTLETMVKDTEVLVELAAL